VVQLLVATGGGGGGGFMSFLAEMVTGDSRGQYGYRYGGAGSLSPEERTPERPPPGVAPRPGSAAGRRIGDPAVGGAAAQGEGGGCFAKLIDTYYYSSPRGRRAQN
jgi:hypothetical protein